MEQFFLKEIQKPAEQLLYIKWIRKCVCAKLLQSCPTLCDHVDYSPPGPSVHGFLQARILEWVAMPSSRGLPDPGIELAFHMSPALAGRFFTPSTTQEARIRKYPLHIQMGTKGGDTFLSYTPPTAQWYTVKKADSSFSLKSERFGSPTSKAPTFKTSR